MLTKTYIRPNIIVRFYHSSEKPGKPSKYLWKKTSKTGNNILTNTLEQPIGSTDTIKLFDTPPNCAKIMLYD